MPYTPKQSPGFTVHGHFPLTLGKWRISLPSSPSRSAWCYLKSPSHSDFHFHCMRYGLQQSNQQGWGQGKRVEADLVFSLLPLTQNSSGPLNSITLSTTTPPGLLPGMLILTSEPTWHHSFDETLEAARIWPSPEMWSNHTQSSRCNSALEN